MEFDFKIRQKRGAPSQNEVDARENWMVLAAPAAHERGTKNRFPYQETLTQRRKRATREDTDSEPHVADLPNAAGSRVSFACIKPDIGSFELLTLARKLVAAHKPMQDGATLAAHLEGFTDRQAQRLAEALVAAAAAASVEMPNFKSGEREDHRYRELELYGVLRTDAYRRTLAEAEGNALSRYLSMLPPNELTPASYLSRLRKLSRAHGWKLGFLDAAALKRKKAGAFLAVAQGSPVADAGIAVLRYAPPGAAAKNKVALVGKGICYDTGGTNLKPAKYMFGMHEDMQGSAVALGTLLALTRLKVRYPVECWLALATNHIGPKAYKPNDVVIASDGTAIEVVHTDAEGRMVLADTLVQASNGKPALIIDYATLTGACVYSLGTAYSGVFTNRDDWLPALIKAGRDSGERVWPFPMDEDYETALKSDIADVKQCAIEGNADHILAARFLNRFVKHDTPWIHVDLSASKNKGGLGHVPTDTIGFGVRYTLNLLMDNDVRKK